MINATATCLTAGTSACSAIGVTANSGTWQVFLDNTSPDANQSAGTGFMDGVNIMAGTWDRGDSTFLYDGNPEGPHAGDIGTLTGTMTMANETYMNSGLVDTSLQASLRFPGLPAPQFTRPEAFNGIGPNDNESSSFVIQVGSSQHFAPNSGTGNLRHVSGRPCATKLGVSPRTTRRTSHYVLNTQRVGQVSIIS